MACIDDGDLGVRQAPYFGGLRLFVKLQRVAESDVVTEELQDLL
jgi:hypothetical protein